MRLGWIIGEPLLVDHKTKSRKKCDIGKFLVLIPHKQSCPAQVRMQDGRRLFSVSMKEEASQSDEQWIRSFMGLKMDEVDTSAHKSGDTINLSKKDVTRDNGDCLDQGKRVGEADNDLTSDKTGEP
ncbi:hypothetical protein Dsin_014942 [Dipteronia sinensis]|uniref:Uncharacterized protein n=1 Tax=Dipteronia sinensis TaxID=43782 RepID=A0AAE0EAT6_9ROSI|nr:hypothetical protein Dsin_014942 [Dipteronia sinensis]